MNFTKKLSALKQSEIDYLEKLILLLKSAPSLTQKISILDQEPQVRDFQDFTYFHSLLKPFDSMKEYLFKSILAIGQGPIIFNVSKIKENNSLQEKLLNTLFAHLSEVEQFYQYLGGVIGYHATILKLIQSHALGPESSIEKTEYIHPIGLNLADETPDVLLAIRKGLENLPHIAEIYPVGGAGDRLNLTDQQTGAHLPAALLKFNGHTLLSGLIRDLQAREYLYFKLYDKQVNTPVAMMTSEEKNNHFYILSICESHHWFGRHKESFYFFIQPLVPVLTIEGNWSLTGPLELSLKPGGHGVIWKLAEEQGIFNQLILKGYKSILIRQINNPVAGTDFGLLALAGVGMHQKKALGFLSCERFLNTAEGTNVLIEKKKEGRYDYCLTNIEYTDFDQKGVNEVPDKPGSPYSRFPTNTNILFADINSIREGIKKCPIPGLLINMKNQVSFIDDLGKQSFMEGGRLESTMQNIADIFIDSSNNKLEKNQIEKILRTFITYNKRSKTISTTKTAFKKDQSPVGTPEQANYDRLSNCYDLFKNYCRFQLPANKTFEEYLLSGPDVVINYHPALGPLYSIISQKIHNGLLAKGAELQLEIAEAAISELDLAGSLLVESSSPLGKYDNAGILHYGNESRCYLHRIKVRNRGINFSANNIFWKNEIFRHESLHILLQEGSEFYAEDVFFEGSLKFEVPSFHRLVIKQENGKLIQELTQINAPSWKWTYSYDVNNFILLQKHTLLNKFTQNKP